MAFFEEFINVITTNTITDFGISIAIILSFTLFGSTISSFIIRLLHIKEKKFSKIKRHAFYKPLKQFISILGIYIALKILYLPPIIVLFIDKIFTILTILLIARAISNLFNNNSSTYEFIRKLLDFNGSDAVIKLLANVIKIVIYIIAGFIIIKELGYDLSGLAAGLGIFSAVVALAAQDLAKNVIAGCSIFTDKPFVVGDYIEFNTFVGTVENITFRSTRIRNLEDQLVVIPNSQIADSALINYTKMKKRHFHLDLTLDLSTKLEDTMSLLDKLKTMFINNPNILNENIKTYFSTISANGIDIVIDFYTDIIDYMSFLNFKQNINYEILDLISKEGIKLAYDTKTIYVKQ